MNARRFHRLNAELIGLFIFLHLSNHVAILWGAETHIAFMDALRVIYRHPIIESLLYCAFAFQIFLGVKLLLKRGWPKRRALQIQNVSGFLLGVFLIQHLLAVVVIRATQTQLDTNIYWAASVVLTKPYSYYFIPYYAVGILSLFVHIGMVFYIRPRLRPLSFFTIGIGFLVTAAIIPSLLGIYGQSIVLPDPYNSYLPSLGVD